MEDADVGWNARDAFYREYVNPFLRGRGFGRQGRTYRRLSVGGDVAVVHFQVSMGSCAAAYRFYINIAVVPKPWLDFCAVEDERWSRRSRPPSASDGMYQRRVWGGPDGDLWTVGDLSALPGLWAQLEGPLSADIAQAVALLDHDTFLAYAEQRGRGVISVSEMIRAVLLVDSVSSERMETLIAELERLPRTDDLVEWLRSRRAGQEAGSGTG